ncbi:hypothetical protein NJ959_02250 [Symplocastrum sp. BBK-W-15]|uniref:Uncharacterized protein n=1 Tax=Limnofasciculus baicalensis BBK-W-15 TaxID=2699891 RepID=A0AAE3GMU6_9CYAN|nr:hypothetical protein [Limnofasciculus baicalensis BBK-W-15]
MTYAENADKDLSMLETLLHSFQKQVGNECFAILVRNQPDRFEQELAVLLLRLAHKLD